MKIVHIKQKLEDIGVPISDINLGMFDWIGEYTAKRTRNIDDPNFKRIGYTYKSSYERGMLIYYLIRQFSLSSYIEVGFGRGYSAMCAAKAFYDLGINGKVVTIDPEFNDNHMATLQQVFPKHWFKCFEFLKGVSQQVLPAVTDTFDIAYIDGDHSYEATKSDWKLLQNKFAAFCLFDDYHLPSKNDPGIKCSQAIDEIDFRAEKCLEPEFLRLDRRILLDDRGFTDEQIDYGQVLFQKESVRMPNDW